jgi:L-ornithine Nalpha-acyltransferase
MKVLERGRYRARLASSEADFARAADLRQSCFRQGGAKPDSDAFDPRCQHLLIEAADSGDLVCCFRLMGFGSGDDISQSYSAQFYHLTGLRNYRDPMLEVGRFCIRAGLRDPDILRLAWGALTAIVDQRRVGMLFGCSSFKGLEAARYRDVFSLLLKNHLAPKIWRPLSKAPDVVRFSADPTPDLPRALKGIPPLLRTYLAMGGWVSDHAVVDRDLGGLHVFTGLEINSIPPARARLLRAISG